MEGQNYSLRYVWPQDSEWSFVSHGYPCGHFIEARISIPGRGKVYFGACGNSFAQCEDKIWQNYMLIQK